MVYHDTYPLLNELDAIARTQKQGAFCCANSPATTVEESPALELLTLKAKSNKDFSFLKPLKMSRLSLEATSSHKCATLSIVSSCFISGLDLSQLRVSSSSRPWCSLEEQLNKIEHLVVSDCLERFSNDCRKTKAKVTTSTNHNRSKQRDEPIKIRSNYQ